MKFKVTKKDFMLFVLYCVILLYFCTIAVLNFSTLAESGSFYGLIPYPQDFLETNTLIIIFALFVGILILIFTSISSYIFEKDKGGLFGIRFSEKSSDGYSKWADEKEIKNDKGVVCINANSSTIDAAGIPLINNGDKIWVDDGEYHNMVIGATGSGKTECIVKPLVNILGKKGESMVITDPKGEIYEYCGEYLKSQGYKIVILDIRDPELGNAWNPLSLPYQYYKIGNNDKATELLEDVSANILFDKESKEDPFWERSAADYFSGLALALFKDAENESQVNINSINQMSIQGEERRGATPYIKEYFGYHGEDSPEYIFASNTITAPQDTKGSILSTFRQKVRQFSTKQNLSEMLSYSDFDMREIGNNKTAVFMIVHDEKKTYHSLMTIFTKQCYETLIDCAQKNGGKLKYRTNFILDEFANMPPLKDVDAMITAARSRSIRFTFIIQNFSQLDDVYGAEVAQTIKGNCGNLIYLISTELKALEEISKMCGEIKSKDKDKTASTPLITISDLQKLKLFQAIIIRWRKNPFKTNLTPDFKIDWGHKHDKATIPGREKTEIQIFNLKEFVSTKKNDDALSGNSPSPMGGMGMGPMGGMGGFNPFLSGGNNSFNPFMGNDKPSSPQGNPTLNPFAGPSSAGSNPYANLSDNDIDQMVKDIEKKLKELDEEEERERQKHLSSEKEVVTDVFDKKDFEEKESILKDEDKEDSDDNQVININDLKLPEVKENEYIEMKDKSILEKIEEIDKNERKKQIKEEEVNPLDLTKEINIEDINKSKINVDKDSVVLGEKVVTDDEYFDDFFDD